MQHKKISLSHSALVALKELLVHRLISSLNLSDVFMYLTILSLMAIAALVLLPTVPALSITVFVIITLVFAAFFLGVFLNYRDRVLAEGTKITHDLLDSFTGDKYFYSLFAIFGLATAAALAMYDFGGFSTKDILSLVGASAVALSVVSTAVYLSIVASTRKRSIGDRVVNRDLYGAILSRLRERGIPNRNDYIRNDAFRLNACYNVLQLCHSNQLEDRYGISSLVYLIDDEPSVAQDRIVSMVNDRGCTTAKDVRVMMDEMDALSAPLQEGAL